MDKMSFTQFFNKNIALLCLWALLVILINNIIFTFLIGYAIVFYIIVQEWPNFKAKLASLKEKEDWDEERKLLKWISITAALCFLTPFPKYVFLVPATLLISFMWPYLGIILFLLLAFPFGQFIVPDRWFA